MTTKLDKALKREIEVNGVLYTLTFSPDGIKIVEKGKRLGQEIAWRDLISGSNSLTRDLSNSLSGGGSEG